MGEYKKKGVAGLISKFSAPFCWAISHPFHSPCEGWVLSRVEAGPGAGGQVELVACSGQYWSMSANLRIQVPRLWKWRVPIKSFVADMAQRKEAAVVTSYEIVLVFPDPQNNIPKNKSNTKIQKKQNDVVDTPLLEGGSWARVWWGCLCSLSPWSLPIKCCTLLLVFAFFHKSKTPLQVSFG